MKSMIFRYFYFFAILLIMNSCRGESPLPNIIFIMADDLGYAEIGCYGQQLLQTPNLDEMAKEGMRFTNAYSGAQVCAPSRSVLMTGQHTGHTRVRQNSGKFGGVPDEITGKGHRIPLEDNDFTVAELMKNAGYVTGLVGKWGLGEAGSSGEPNRQGFDQFYGFLNQNHADDYYTDYLWRNGYKEAIPDNNNGQEKVYVHDLFTNEAIEFIRRNKDESFFLYLAYTIPHFNIEVPVLEDYVEQTDWSENQKIFASMVTRMDRDVGRIRGELRKLGVEENTLIFFTSDNGPAITDRISGRDSLFNKHTPFRGNKGDLDEGGIRVPMIVCWPGNINGGTINNQPWYFADIMPTLAEISGRNTPDNIDGISILSALKNEEHILPKRYMYWENPSGELDQTVRFGKWNIRVKGGDGGYMKLFNLEDDPGQSIDLASEYPEVVANFKNYLKTARTESPHWPQKNRE